MNQISISWWPLIADDDDKVGPGDLIRGALMGCFWIAGFVTAKSDAFAVVMAVLTVGTSVLLVREGNGLRA